MPHPLQPLFADGLSRLLSAHAQGARQAEANRRTATDPALRRMLKKGAAANLKQARRIEAAFKAAGLAPRRRHDEAMQGIADANTAMARDAAGPMTRDLVHIASGQAAAHLYLANYGTVRDYARALGQGGAAKLLGKTLRDTAKIDRGLTKLARRITAPGSTVQSRHPFLTVVAVALVGAIATAAALSGAPEARQ